MNELNDLVMRFEEDGEASVPMIDEEDPDWDESVERKKIRQQQMRAKRRGFGKSKIHLSIFFLVLCHEVILNFD